MSTPKDFAIQLDAEYIDAMYVKLYESGMTHKQVGRHFGVSTSNACKRYNRYCRRRGYYILNRMGG